MLREATIHDIPKLVKMGREFSNLMPLEYDENSMAKTFEFLINSDKGVVFVNQNVTGTIGGFLDRAFFNNNLEIATELFWWVNPLDRGDGKRLLEAFEEWSSNLGAYSVQMTCLEWSNPDKLGRLYENRGYQPTEHHYMRIN